MIILGRSSQSFLVEVNDPGVDLALDRCVEACFWHTGVSLNPSTGLLEGWPLPARDRIDRDTVEILL